MSCEENVAQVPCEDAESGACPHLRVMEYTVGEETAHVITHGLGAALGVAALSILVVFASLWGDAWKVVAFSIYGSSLVLLYLASTVYHAVQSPRFKGLCRVLDHSAIYLLIAGTYTPFTIVNMRGPWGWSLFGIVWGLAVFGIAGKALFFGKLRVLSVAPYLAMGWVVLVALKPALRTIDPAGLAWLVGGGLCYSLGTIFYVWERLPYNHAIWHLFVLAGSILHFFAILFHVLPV